MNLLSDMLLHDCLFFYLLLLIYLGHYKEHLIEDSTFSSTVMHMGLLVESLWYFPEKVYESEDTMREVNVGIYGFPFLFL